MQQHKHFRIKSQLTNVRVNKWKKKQFRRANFSNYQSESVSTYFAKALGKYTQQQSHNKYNNINYNNSSIRKWKEKNTLKYDTNIMRK